ncbi:MAG TPA: 3-ketoacyl-ACP reductase [Candidatus Latescibacteria bacterium]|nr:3-ketoacyl-ACP reductase [Gemmatimonadota bacterium]HCR17618.1 3-ketoacyl-ACP reductase [Candidatus Latescibacterota bacterium]|tara:strand:- start:4417 stop:5160 length:744 start_codon:yes stop_codon:yes gene_type:complete
MSHLSGKVALITGGGTGIGRETGLMLAENGADIIVNYSRSETEAEETVAAIQGLGRKAFSICADVVDDSAVRKMFESASREFGRLDILVNNAGITRFVPLIDLEGLSDELWDPVFDINVKGTFYCSRAAIPKMKKNSGGQIINVASIAGIVGVGSSIAYCASKAAVISLTKSMAISQAPDIRVNAVAPGVAHTRWIAGQEEFVKSAIETTPLKRIATAKDVANAIFGLAIGEFITGQVLVVDGGRIL